MAEYTPTTEELKHQYLAVYSVFGSGAVETHGGEFDRWLNQVKAEAWDEGYEQTGYPVENPYRRGTVERDL